MVLPCNVQHTITTLGCLGDIYKVPHCFYSNSLFCHLYPSRSLTRKHHRDSNNLNCSNLLLSTVSPLSLKVSKNKSIFMVSPSTQQQHFNKSKYILVPSFSVLLAESLEKHQGQALHLQNLCLKQLVLHRAPVA